MTHYSVQPRGRKFVKVYGFLSFAKNMSKTICKIISKILSDQYSQKFIGHAKKYPTDSFKTTSKRAIQKTAKVTGDLIDINAVDKIKIPSKTSPSND